MRNATPLLVLLPALALSGCGLIKVQGNMKTVTSINGVTETREVKFDRLEDLPAALEQAGDHLSQTTGALKAALLDAPPPGVVRLGDLSPSLASYDGKKGLDFLVAAREAFHAQPVEGASEPFTYVRIGVPTFDQFFKQAAEFHALTFQVRQAVGQAKRLSAALLDAPPDASTGLSELVSRALAVPRTGQNAEMADRLSDVKGLLVQAATLAPQVVSRAQGLIAAGQGLVAGAAGSITNPKTLLHLDLIKQGLTESVSVVAESASLLSDLVSEVGGFGG